MLTYSEALEQINQWGRKNIVTQNVGDRILIWLSAINRHLPNEKSLSDSEIEILALGLEKILMESYVEKLKKAGLKNE